MVQFHKAVDFYHQEMKPYFRNRPKKPLHVQIGEIFRLGRKYRYAPYQYLKCGLYLASARGIDVTDYLPPHLIRKVQERLNPREARPVVKDKVLFRRRLEAHGLPAVRELLHTDAAGRIFDGEDRPLSSEQALALLRARGGEIFVKPIDGTWGRNAGVHAAAAVTAGMLARPNLLLQPRLAQHPVLETLYPHAVNTVRIDTLLTEAGWISNAAVLKLGVGGATVDNGSAGGLLVGIDLETGVLDDAGRQRPPFSAEEYHTHPDTGAAFGGVVLPFWDLVPEGVCLLEANSFWGINILQTGRRGMAGTPIGRLAGKMHGLPDPPGL